MSAYVVSAAGPPEVLVRQSVPRPQPKNGWVLIQVRAFGINRSEMFTRQGHSPSVRFPRVLGIEAVGTVADGGGSEFELGARVAALMGGMGRDFDGSYAEFVLVPAACVIRLDSALEWPILGALPEMFQTAWGSLHRGLRIARDQSLLIRGASSSVGMLSIVLAKATGTSVIATTRSAAKQKKLEQTGADEVLIDDGSIAAALRSSHSGGVDAVLELVGTTTLKDSLTCCRPGGTVCMSGILGNEWQFSSFAPMDEIPHTVRLTVYSGGSSDLDTDAFNAFLRHVADHPDTVPVDRVFSFDELVEAHRYMESNRAQGKLVVVI